MNQEDKEDIKQIKEDWKLAKSLIKKEWRRHGSKFPESFGEFIGVWFCDLDTHIKRLRVDKK